MARREWSPSRRRLIVVVVAVLSVTGVPACYLSSEIGAPDDEDATPIDAGELDAQRADSGPSHDASTDAVSTIDAGDAAADAAVSRLPPFCVTDAVDTVRLELTSTPFLTVVQNTSIRRFDTDGHSWAVAGGVDVTPGFQIGCDVLLGHRADTALETGSCVQGVTRLSPAGATRELNNALARTVTDSASGGNVVIASSTVLRYDGSVWRLELDLASTVSTEGPLRAVAHEGGAGLLLGVGRSLFRTTAPLQLPTKLLAFPSDIVSIARDAATGTTLVGTSSGTVHVVRNDVEQGSFETGGGVEEIFVRAGDSFLIRTRTTVFQFAHGTWSSAFVAQANEHLADLAIDDFYAFTVVVRDGTVDACERIRFVSLD